jgi:hypothetical protein
VENHAFTAARRRDHIAKQKMNPIMQHHVLEPGTELWAGEIKLTASPGGMEMDSLNKTADLIGATRRFLVSRTGKVAGDDRRASCNLSWFVDFLQRRAAR